MSARVFLNKISVPTRTKLTPRSRNAAKEAFKRVLKAQSRSYGPACPIKRIPLKTAEDISLSLGPDVAARL